MNIFPKAGFIRIVRRMLAVVAVAVLAGCVTVGPDYVPPQTAVSPVWNAPLQGGLTDRSDAPDLVNWWTKLNDPELSKLVERAVTRNRDLKKAEARIREARARRGLSGAGLYPTLDASASASRTRTDPGAGSAATTDLFSTGLDASWEIDLFGGTRRAVEAADADIQAAGEDLHDTLVSLLAEVALNYIDLRTGQTRLAVTEASLKSQEETYRLTQWAAEAGLSDDLAVRQAAYTLEGTRAQIPNLRNVILEIQNRLAVLLGEVPGAIQAELEAAGPIPVIPPEVAVGVPADLLRQRPDVRRAERQLAAQTARIGVAAADLHPKLKLSGTIGIQALTFGGLFSSANETTAGGSSGITWRLFDAGAIRRNIEIQSALQEQYLIAYESVVLAALEEAENAISAYAREQQRRRSLGEAVRAAEAASELAGIKYRAGLTDFGTLLEADRSLLNLRDQLAQSDGTVATNLVKLYKALGGGWTTLRPGERVKGEKS